MLLRVHQRADYDRSVPRVPRLCRRRPARRGGTHGAVLLHQHYKG
ncbi:hypothetical protein E2C01_084860 [Portunus trituberculatus]|uniref:Uncharacterized protein n=1 Tax=Portunus trituberculatus TaxID=210409 RepID=A0A5B7J8V9_PORTR|nr:hypothetical protein [Portunus trituberculatus]